jgi:hypothetical protein
MTLRPCAEIYLQALLADRIALSHIATQIRLYVF